MSTIASLIVMLLCLAGAPALAQTSDPSTTPATAAPVSATTRVDAAKVTVDQVQATLSRSDDFADEVLTQLRAEVDPVPAQMNAVIGEVTPQIDAAKAQLAQLGPKPGEKDPPEPPAVSADRASQEQLFGNLDAVAKRAKVLAVQARQIADTIDTQIRSRFAHALFRRSPSILDPRLWIAVAEEIPSDLSAVGSLTTDWLTAASHKLSRTQRIIFFGLLVLLGLVCWPIWRIAARLRQRADDAEPRRLAKALAAARVTLATAAVPALAMLALSAIVQAFDLPPRFLPLGEALVIGICVFAIMAGLMRGVLAPRNPNWRLVPLPDAASKILYTLMISITGIVAVERFAQVANDMIDADPFTTTVATRGLGVLCVVAVMMAQARKGIRASRASRTESYTAQTEHWISVIKSVSWTLLFVLLLAVLIGYAAFAAFLIEQITAVAGTLALLYLLLAIIDEGVVAVVEPQGEPRRDGIVLGFKADTVRQAIILVAGLVKLVLYLAAILLVLAPWRIESGDMLPTIEAAFFGFSVGEVTISLSSILVAVVLFGGTIGLTRALQHWLEGTYLPHTKLDVGLQNSIKTSLGYLGVLLALGVSLAHLGLSFERLTLIAGGLSVGIGLGLQTITNNFVSGLILLWERAVRVGDRISVGEEHGYVRRINVRSTEIETFDRALVVMPNSSLITGVVKNWVRNDRVGRITLPFVLPLTTDPEEVRAILVKAGKAHDLVLAIPSPQVFFTTMTDTQIRMELICYVEDVESALRVTSDLLFVIYANFKDIGVVAPAALPSVTSPALDKLDAWLNAKTAASLSVS